MAIEQSKTALATSTSCIAIESIQQHLGKMQREMESLCALATRPNTDTSGQNAVSVVNANLETCVAVWKMAVPWVLNIWGSLQRFSMVKFVAGMMRKQ